MKSVEEIMALVDDLCVACVFGGTSHTMQVSGMKYGIFNAITALAQPAGRAHNGIEPGIALDSGEFLPAQQINQEMR